MGIKTPNVTSTICSRNDTTTGLGSRLRTRLTTIQNQPLHLGHGVTFMINGRMMTPGQGGRFENQNVPLPKTPGGKARIGTMSTWVVDNNLHITQTVNNQKGVHAMIAKSILKKPA